MRVRAIAMLKIDRILQSLDEVDRRAIAYETYRVYFNREGVHKESTKSEKESTRSPQGVHKPPGDVHKESTKQGATPELCQDVVPAVASSNGFKNQQLQEEAKEVLHFLNEKTGKSYRTVETNLVLIKSCLKSGATLPECRGVIARKVRQWKGTEMEKYLRPATLFNRTKFEQYLGEQDA